MKSWFNMDSPLFTALALLADLIIVNALTLVLCVPIVTAGAAFTAMHYVLWHGIRSEGGSVIKMYFHSFKQNFRQSAVIWLIVLFIGILLYFDRRVLSNFDGSRYTEWSVIWIMLLLIYIGWICYLFPLLSRYENTIGGFMKNAFILIFGCFPRTFGMLGIWAIAAGIVYVLDIRGIPLYLLVGISMPAYFCARIYNPVFKKLEGETEGQEEMAASDKKENAAEQ